MVSPGMRRYRHRTEEQARLVGSSGGEPLDFPALFGRRAPVRLEVGFGHGEFISQMAAAHPDEDFVGVDLNDLRTTKAAHKSNRLDAANVRVFNDEAHRFVRSRIPPASVHRVYILFPDPWPKAGHRRRRLMNRSFLLDVAWALQPGGRLVIASDTHNYAFQALWNCTTLPGLWLNRYPGGFRFDIPTRFPTVFERHKKSEGWSICYLLLERTAAPAPPRIPWPARSEDGDDETAAT
jgi:tRNA (guanine-N7-)-methyltransferase